MLTPHVLDVTDATFRAEVLEASAAVPVIVDIWAPWCAPCRALAPVLEKLAAEYAGRFRLARVNSDENPGIARGLNVRSIPDVRAFHGGEQVDQFLGALPESEVRAFIDGVAPSPAELLRLEAAGKRAAGDASGAAATLAEALALDAAHDPARIDLAEVLIETGRHDDAARELDSVGDDPDWSARVTALRQAIAFARVGGAESELAARVAAAPGDHEARLARAGALAARKAWREAMDELLEILARDKGWRDGEARKQMVAIFSLATDRPDLVSEYRRKLGSVLY
ncbi:MAG: tetratricopeptide repeat protein [Burkholderiales bacterium]|nr:tetratricopeptide repeat protein [Burkholderiales bacterium]